MCAYELPYYYVFFSMSILSVTAAGAPCDQKRERRGSIKDKNKKAKEKERINKNRRRKSVSKEC